MLNFLLKLFNRKNAAAKHRTGPVADKWVAHNDQGMWFDAQWYVQRYPDVSSAGMDAAFHYLHFGMAEGRFPNQYRENTSAGHIYKPAPEELLALLNNCKWFDSLWYLQHYPDVAAANIDAAYHYLHFGRQEGRFAGPQSTAPSAQQGEMPSAKTLLTRLEQCEWFDAQWYLQRYPDIGATGMDAAVHYLYHGAAEGRLPGPQFDNSYYLSQLDVPNRYASPLLHYLAEGEVLGLKPQRIWRNEPWWWQLPAMSLPVADYAALMQRLTLRSDVVVVIPVFNAVNALERCLQAIALHHQGISRVIIIDDASTDVAISRLLAQYQHDSWYYCVKNEENLGFSGSVNLGMALAAEYAPAADVVLLNSDTEVTSGWLRQLRYAAYCDDNIATVTPVSNNAGAFSVPQAGENSLPQSFNLTRFARICMQGGVLTYPEVPTGNGFCLYIRRAALNQLGYFDAEAFPRGYGEENDFCMRAVYAGWQHLIAPRAFVYHQRAASFGAEKAALLKHGRQIVDQRYPDYSRRVQAAFSSQDVENMRNRATLLAALPEQQSHQVRPRALFVIATRTGGTPQTNQDLMLALSKDVECFVLHCDSRKMTLQHFAEGIYTEVQSHNLQQPLQALSHMCSEYDEVVATWLIKWAIELVHVRHLAWHSLGLLSVVKTLGLPLVHSFHDFYTLCPTVKLLDEQGRYCAATCTASTGICKHELWPESAFTQLKHQQIYDWQKLFEKQLLLCDAFVTTNSQARTLILEKYPSLGGKPFAVIGHGRDFSTFASLACLPQAGEKLRILCPGNISVAKGLALINELASRYPHQFEIHILGKVSNELILPDNVVQHGDYEREQFLPLVAQIKPHCGAVLSIWPETWCHTLTELWAAGVPVIGLPFGAVAERIKYHGAGWVAADATAEQIAAIVLQPNFVADWQLKQQAVHAWQQQYGKQQSCQHMAEQYLALYQSLLPAITCSVHTGLG
jgi:GT2 family glycosyltransferase/glycosyltransferase involved in cell wall biosynthesis